MLGALVDGCIFGKLCLYPSKEARKCFYSAIAVTDCFLVSLHKNDIYRMVENQKKRILNDQMTFLKAIPSPQFTILSKKKLQSLCEALQIYTCIKGQVIFNQDDPLKYIYIVKDGLFMS